MIADNLDSVAKLSIASLKKYLIFYHCEKIINLILFFYHRRVSLQKSVEEFESNIDAIKIALGSFTNFEGDVKGRKNYLKSHLSLNPHLSIYFSFTEKKTAECF